MTRLESLSSKSLSFGIICHFITENLNKLSLLKILTIQSNTNIKKGISKTFTWSYQIQNVFKEN